MNTLENVLTVLLCAVLWSGFAYGVFTCVALLMERKR